MAVVTGFGLSAVLQKMIAQNNSELLSNADDSSFSPLHWAAINGHERAVGFLLKQGVPINQTTSSGWTVCLATPFIAGLTCVVPRHSIHCWAHLCCAAVTAVLSLLSTTAALLALSMSVSHL